MVASDPLVALYCNGFWKWPGLTLFKEFSKIPTLSGCERILWLFFFGSREKNALALDRQLESHLSMTLMNYKCQPVALYSEQTINVMAWQMVAEEPSWFYGSNYPWVLNIWCTGFKYLIDCKYLMDWDNILKSSSAVTERWQPNVDAICYLPPNDQIFNLENWVKH